MSLEKINTKLPVATSAPVKVNAQLSPEKTTSLWQQVKSKMEQYSKSASNFVNQHKHEIKVGAAGTGVVALLTGAFLTFRKSIGVAVAPAKQDANAAGSPASQKSAPAAIAVTTLEFYVEPFSSLGVNLAMPTFAEAREFVSGKFAELKGEWQKLDVAELKGELQKLDVKALYTDKFNAMKAFFTKEKIWEFTKQNPKKVVAAGVLVTAIVAKKVLGGTWLATGKSAQQAKRVKDRRKNILFDQRPIWRREFVNGTMVSPQDSEQSYRKYPITKDTFLRKNLVNPKPLDSAPPESPTHRPLAHTDSKESLDGSRSSPKAGKPDTSSSSTASTAPVASAHSQPSSISTSFSFVLSERNDGQQSPPLSPSGQQPPSLSPSGSQSSIERGTGRWENTEDGLYWTTATPPGSP